eukprot:7732703-Ditylum_brightwellii.AAC.1
MAFDYCWHMLLLTIPCAVDLSTCIGVGGCACPILSNVVCSVAASFAFSNRAPSSASAANTITFQRIVETTNTGLFLVVVAF